jgi:putrescine transport system permease protein
MTRRPLFLMTCLCFGFAFFYIPILSMIFFSFNKSRLATVWGGFSLQWYGKLFDNDQIMNAALLSRRGSRNSAAARCSPAWSPRRSSCPR